MSEHPVRRKLRQEIIPYVVSADLLRKAWYYRLHAFYSYWGDMIAGLSALGIGHPLINAFLPPNSENKGVSVDLSKIIEGSSAWFLIPGFISALAWFGARMIFTREDGRTKAVLARSCCRSFQQIELKLHLILIGSYPMPELSDLALTQVQPLVDRGIQDGFWIWAGPAPEIDSNVEIKLGAFCEKYENNWVAAPPLFLSPSWKWRAESLG